VDDVSFELGPGETQGLVGESGCGKTSLGRAVIRLLEPTSGQIILENVDLTQLNGSKLRAMRRKFQMIFQDPYGSLDPRMTIEDIIGEALDIHQLVPNRQARRERVAALLRDVGLDDSHARRFPHEFSGGQRQRIGIARAIALRPQLIVADEATSALDVSLRAQMLDLLLELRERLDLSYVFISHDISVVRYMCDRVAVMHLGKVVELGETGQICDAPRHAYTQSLISAVPRPDPRLRGTLTRIRYRPDAASVI
jgi:ABC-type oligopeptide transport system ATPase subunit